MRSPENSAEIRVDRRPIRSNTPPQFSDHRSRSWSGAMKRVLCCLVVLTGIAAAQAPDPAVKDQPPSIPVVVLASEEVKAPPRLEHVRHAFERVAAELSVVRKELPHVIVFYVSRAGADTQHLPKNTSIAVE